MITENKNPLLKVEELKVGFQTEEGMLLAVDGVSFCVSPGQILGIVGESGCGKSVTALSVIRLIPNPPGKIMGGRILWKGKNLLSLSQSELPNIRGSQIAMIFQNPMSSLNPVFTVGRQLEEVLKIRYKLYGEKARKRIMDTLVQVGLSDPASRMNSYPHELSGGMMQRIMIAMALLSEPELLIADEPTTALDVTIQAQILQLIRDLQQKTGMAVILITHDMGVIAETCDTVVVMYAGCVAEQARIENLFENSFHPYTRSLLKSIPKRGATREKPLFTIEGTVPSLVKPPSGCRFAKRCFQRKKLKKEHQDICFNKQPELQEVEKDHLAACHFPLANGKTKL